MATESRKTDGSAPAGRPAARHAAKPALYVVLGLGSNGTPSSDPPPRHSGGAR
jgi:hypothetical protein